MLLFACGATFNARAQNCTFAYPAYPLDMLWGDFRGFFGSPDEIATLPVGSKVGALREVNLTFRCIIPHEQSTPLAFGTGRKAAPGIFLDAATNTYTNAQLSALGLGYRMWWHEPVYKVGSTVPTKHNPVAHSNSDPTQDALPDNWYGDLCGGNSSCEYEVPVRIIFFKINNNFQNTNGVYVPVNATANLFSIYFTQPSSPTVPFGQAHTYTLQLDTFSSAKRACTPQAPQNINLVGISVTDIPFSGKQVLGNQFSLEFTCPYLAYHAVGFKLEAVDGVLDAANAVFGIEQGAGFAQGVGIQIVGRQVSTSRRPSQNYEGNLILKPETAYHIPWFQYSQYFDDSIENNPATGIRSKTVDFSVYYYRMPGVPLHAGNVRSRILLHFFYQ